MISGQQADCLQQAAALVPATAAALWISTAAGLPQALPASKARLVLGQEFDALVFDAHSGLDVNALAAVSGTLRGGGTLYLLTPPLQAWAAFPDPDYHRFLPYPYQAADVTGRFLQRLVAMLRDIPIAKETPPNRPDTFSVANAPLSGEGQEMAVSLRSSPDKGRLGGVSSQSDVVAAIVQATAPIVLSADRGRGKSAALGMAASRLQAQGKRVLLTAPARATAGNVFKHATLPLTFLAPDALLQTLPAADVLLVDEAAAIPVPLLLHMAQHYPRCVFATTLHGYEGSGRGFVLRFQQALAQLAPEWQALRLQQPIRWAANDPLEQWLNRVLLLDAEPTAFPALGRLREGGIEYHHLNRDHLVTNEPLLRQLFGLLISAHYQTRPSDLRQLLDAPNLSVHVLQQQDRVLAVALLSREGGLDAELTAAIYAGTRRPHGHLVPQTLTFHARIPHAAQLQCERVMRLAVHPDCQRQGLGAQLVQHLLDYAATQGADYLGVSYAMSPELLRFWQRHGFVTARVGQRQDTASGSVSVVQVRGLTPAGKQLLNFL